MLEFNKLSKAEMKSVVGGVVGPDVCPPGEVQAYCLYNDNPRVVQGGVVQCVPADNVPGNCNTN